MKAPACRICFAALQSVMVDLGLSPLANAYPSIDADEPEVFYPLRVYVCDRCFLVQANDVQAPENIFSEYAYFSSYSQSWLEQSERFAEMASRRFSLDSNSKVVEIASNDGYLLQYFAKRGVSVLGVEPARNVAAVAIEKGIPTEVAFFGRETAARLLGEGQLAHFIVANNVIAHVPDLHDFVAGMAELLAPSGVATVEFQHVKNVLENNQFDTIYHEHFCYHSLITIEKLFAKHGLSVFDVEELATHGGSLRLFLDKGVRAEEPRVELVRARERSAGLERMETYEAYGERVAAAKRAVLSFFIEEQARGKTFAAYGAPAKGNTFLNYCGIGADFLSYTVDRNPHKQGHYLPGLRIPIREPGHVAKTRPDYLFILPWNLRDEIMDQMKEVREWGCRFVVAVPKLEVLS
jgi:SAM-dependent methyltransferase